MFLTAHAAVGIVISQHVDKPLNIFLLGVLSHFILDFIPHGDEHLFKDEEWKVQKKYKRVVLFTLADFVLLGGVIVFLYGTADLPERNRLIAGILGSVFPDVVSHSLPFFHEKLNWLAVVRWLHTLLKKAQFGRFLTIHNKLHVFLHNLMKFRLSQNAGLAVQGIVTIASLIAALLYYQH